MHALAYHAYVLHICTEASVTTLVIIFPVIRCWRKRSAKSMSVPMQNRSKILPKTVIIIMKKKKTFLFFEMVVRIRCHVKFEPTFPYYYASMIHAYIPHSERIFK